MSRILAIIALHLEESTKASACSPRGRSCPACAPIWGPITRELNEDG